GRLGQIPLADLVDRVRGLEQRARAQLQTDGFEDGETSLDRYVECRYVGQGYELRIPAPPGEMTDVWVTEVAAAFHAAHEREYAHSRPESQIELINLGVQGIARLAVA